VKFEVNVFMLIVIPYKMKRNEFLSNDENEYDTIHSKKRIMVEHIIIRLKKYMIMSDNFMNELSNYSKVSGIVAGLINHRILTQ